MPVLEIRNLVKRFGPVEVLKSISIDMASDGIDVRPLREMTGDLEEFTGDLAESTDQNQDKLEKFFNRSYDLFQGTTRVLGNFLGGLYNIGQVEFIDALIQAYAATGSTRLSPVPSRYGPLAPVADSSTLAGLTSQWTMAGVFSA